MLGLAFLVAFNVPQFQAGSHYLALRGTPAMFDAAGKRVDPLKVLLHELTFLERDPAGFCRFRLDGGRIVKAKARDLLGGTLVPLLETKEVRDLRRRYLGRRVWAYSNVEFTREAPSLPSSDDGHLEPAQSVRIAQIYRLDCDRSSPLLRQMNLARGKVFTDPESPFLVVLDAGGVKLPPLQDDRWSVEKNWRAQDSRRYGFPYQLLEQGWLLDRMYSLMPPSDSEKRAIRRVKKDFPGGLYGLTHAQTAWAYGLPYDPIPLAKAMRIPVWRYGELVEITFKGDHVASFFNDIPH